MIDQEYEVNTVVITRHAALIQYLIEINWIDSDTPVLSHAGVEDVIGKHVIGVLPNHLACLTHLLTEVPLALQPEDRGKELSLERIREIAGSPVTYRIRRWT